MKKKYFVILIIIIVVIISGYLFTRFSVLKQKKVPENKHKAESIIDLRPAIIAKLKQLVKDGSDSLYNLNVQQIDPDILNSKVDIFNASLTPDTVALKRLDAAGKAPDDIFKISFHVLHIKGINVKDLLIKNKINIDTVYADEPNIKVYHTKRAYNEQERKKDAATTLYQKIMKKVSSIVVSQIAVTKGSLGVTDVKEKSTSLYNNVSFKMNNILIESTTQYDKNRFLFAKDAEIATRKYIFRTPDSLYFIKCNTINITTANRTLIAEGVQYVPRKNKQDFQKALKYNKDMYTLTIPKLVISDIDWWKLANKESYISKQVDIYNCKFNIYLDKTLPSAPLSNVNNFPQQVLNSSKIPVLLTTLRVHNTDIAYTEYDPKIREAGTLYFTNLNATMSNITNIKARFKKVAETKVDASALFMKKVPIKATFVFNLPKVKTGDYTADIRAGAMDTTIINPIALPLGLLRLTSGTVQSCTVHLDANNSTSNGKITLLYNDLKITPLKEKKDNKGEFKKKVVVGAIANIFLIKNSNPGKSGEVRTVDFNVERGKATTFFNALWKATLTGILKTVGLPTKLAKQ